MERGGGELAGAGRMGKNGDAAAVAVAVAVAVMGIGGFGLSTRAWSLPLVLSADACAALRNRRVGGRRPRRDGEAASC